MPLSLALIMQPNTGGRESEASCRCRWQRGRAEAAGGLIRKWEKGGDSVECCETLTGRDMFSKRLVLITARPRHSSRPRSTRCVSIVICHREFTAVCCRISGPSTTSTSTITRWTRPAQKHSSLRIQVDYAASDAIEQDVEKLNLKGVSRIL